MRFEPALEFLRTIYKIFRGTVVAVLLLFVTVYAALYILLSVPSFQSRVLEIAEREASSYLGGNVRAQRLVVKPFNEVSLKGLELTDPEGRRCLRVETIGAGVNLWRLIMDKKVEITYAEIIGLDAEIMQYGEGEPLNIDFIIQAFKPKKKDSPPAKFDLNIRNVVIRRSAVTYDKLWIPISGDSLKTDFNHLRLTGLRADITLPKLANNDFLIDVRRLGFSVSGGLDVEKLSAKAHITDKRISLSGLEIELPNSKLSFNDMELAVDGLGNIAAALSEGNHELGVAGRVSPSDLGWLVPSLRDFPEILAVNLKASGNSAEIGNLELGVSASDGSASLNLSAAAKDFFPISENLDVSVESLELSVKREEIGRILDALAFRNVKVRNIIRNVGDIELGLNGRAAPLRGKAEADFLLSTSCGSVKGKAKASGLKQTVKEIGFSINTAGVNVGRILSAGDLGRISGQIQGECKLAGKETEGEIHAGLSSFEWKGMQLGGLETDIFKNGHDITATLSIDNQYVDATLEGEANIEGEESWLELRADVESFLPGKMGLMPSFPSHELSGRIDASLEGSNLDNVTGDFRLTDVSFSDITAAGRDLDLDRLILKIRESDAERSLTLDSDWIEGEVKGNFKLKELPEEAVFMVSKAMPSLVVPKDVEGEFHSNVTFDFKISDNPALPEFFKLPVKPLAPIPVKGFIDGTGNSAKLSIEAPYIQQGKNKLIRDSRLAAMLDGQSGTVTLMASSVVPVKRNEMKIDLQVFGQEDNIFTDIGWAVPDNNNFRGEISFGAELSRNELTSTPDLKMEINPSLFRMGGAKWNIDPAVLSYDGKSLSVDGLKIWNESQFVSIQGKASSSDTDSISVNLAKIDLDYIFETLNINYVSFGGNATGEIKACGAFGPQPVAYTDSLVVKGLSYNGALLGDAVLTSQWENENKKVGIGARIVTDEKRLTVVDGGIWIGRDSLSFDIAADRVPVGFMSPFMSAFASDIKGRASGNVKLFGTFKDVDLAGRVYADSIGLRLDHTNVAYHGADSVFMSPGKISIPSFRIYDRAGHSALLSGELTHRNFHDPAFNFRLSDARGLLCYDTNKQLNPDWYGTFYGNGSGLLKGWPGTVSLSVDMNLTGNSNFTFVLNDTQTAEDYQFITFTDKSKEAAKKIEQDSVSDILSKFRKQVQAQSGPPTKFQMDIRAGVSPGTMMTLVMDPSAGDKITARGSGNIQVEYDSESNEMQMWGKYILDEGNYNFSLQELILRDFSIKSGSSISFNGNPMNAVLDITAAYRVNTNLSDLDKSFSTDRDLNRTNVPVDALLMVDGEMSHPDITFDIELPTLTQDVERKVKSIISTDDMMSRQIIYLLALNRFYTPEYMGAPSNGGGELASVASSTLSSQLSNMIGQLTDKFSVAPTLRSDKGDFSDLEVDVALSSRLLNNRLLINGNFGYRDKSTSHTTFVGDFDIEYLLSKGGNLRLKAYNHFNDQNYYLRQALTTQGLGVVYRREFDNPFTFLRRKSEKKQSDNKEN